MIFDNVGIYLFRGGCSWCNGKTGGFGEPGTNSAEMMNLCMVCSLPIHDQIAFMDFAWNPGLIPVRIETAQYFMLRRAGAVTL